MSGIDETVKRESVYIAAFVGVLSVLMQAVFLVAGHWDYTVLCGNLLSAAAAVGNFFLMGLTVQKALGKGEKEAADTMRLSQRLRLLLLFVVVAVGAAAPCFHTLAVIIPLFIQCSAEEILLRAYVPAVVGRKHSWDVVCFVSGTLFIFHHIFNMMGWGFSGMFCLNVFLLGVLFCLLVWTEGNFWIAAGIHTGWNYIQSYIFSIEASGSPATIGAFRGTMNHANGFFHESYGYEGSVTATILVTAAILWLIYRLNKKGKLDTKIKGE